MDQAIHAINTMPGVTLERLTAAHMRQRLLDLKTTARQQTQTGMVARRE